MCGTGWRGWREGGMGWLWNVGTAGYVTCLYSLSLKYLTLLLSIFIGICTVLTRYAKLATSYLVENSLVE